MNYKMMNFSLSFFLSRALFSLLGISVLIRLDSSTAIADIVIGMILGIVFMKIIPTLPIFFKRLVALFLLFIGTFSFAFTVHLTISKDIPFWILLVITILSFLYFGKKSKTQLGYFAIALFFLSFALTILTWIGLIPNIHFQFLNVSDTNTMMLGSILYFFMTVFPILLLKKEERNILAYGFSSLLNLITILLVFFTLGMTFSSYYSVPHFIMLGEIEYFEIIRRIDQFLFFPDLCAGIILLAYSYQAFQS